MTNLIATLAMSMTMSSTPANSIETLPSSNVSTETTISVEELPFARCHINDMSIGFKASGNCEKITAAYAAYKKLHAQQ